MYANKRIDLNLHFQSFGNGASIFASLFNSRDVIFTFLWHSLKNGIQQNTENELMAYVTNNRLMNDERIRLNKCNSTNIVSAPESVRILLFKECRHRDRQLIFDSYSSHNDNKIQNVQKNENQEDAEFSNLTEMIFGSTALKYYDTYYKIHNVSSPDGLMFTQVFSIPNTKRSYRNSNNRLNSKTSNQLEYDLSSSSLMRSSGDFPREYFSIYRKPTSSTNSSNTMDSGFSEMSFSSNISSQNSFGSVTRSENLRASNTSLSLYNSLESDTDLKCRSQNLNYSRLGLALIVPIMSKTTNIQKFNIQQITLIESMLWRIRRYIELTITSPNKFFATMSEISSLSSSWLLNELKVKSLSKSNEVIPNRFTKLFGLIKKTFLKRYYNRDEEFEKFCSTIKEMDIKETKFFLSSLLTGVLTHHLGWVSSCYSLKEIDIDDSYHAVWKQLTSLYGAPGYLTKTSKTVVYGLKNNEKLKKVIDFLQYFIRYFKVRKRCLVRDEDDILEENKIVDDIINNIEFNYEENVSKPKIGLTKTKKISSNMFDMDNEINKKIETKKTGLTKSKNTNMLNIINDFDTEVEDEEDEYSTEKPLFILGDNDKLQNLNNFGKEIDTEIKTKNELDTIKVKVIKFPLPKAKYTDDFYEVTPHEFLPDLNLIDTFMPDKVIQATNLPEENWKNILKKDLTQKRSCLFQNQLDENVAVLANIDTWDVQLRSSNRNVSDSMVDSSSLVSNMLEVVLEMWKLNMTKENCVTFMEQRLFEICLKANALSQFLLSKDFCTTETLLSSLRLNINDVPLLMSVSSVINPDILQRYGLSYQ